MTIIDQLDHEWPQMAPLPWEHPDPPFSGCATAGAVLARVLADPDPCLVALLRLAQTGDALAGRIVVQLMLPALRASARVHGHDEDEHVSALWPVLMSYPLQARPRAVRSNITLDVLKQVVGRHAPLRPLLPTPRRDMGLADVLLHARREELLPAETSRLLHEVYVDEIPRREVARRHALSEPALRQRCSKAARTLRAHRLALVA